MGISWDCSGLIRDLGSTINVDELSDRYGSTIDCETVDAVTQRLQVLELTGALKQTKTPDARCSSGNFCTLW